jgi:hypothetical protein
VNCVTNRQSSGSRVVPFGRTDMTKLIVTFRNFANAPKTIGGFRAAYFVVAFLRYF